jgi:hypothetical protein
MGRHERHLAAEERKKEVQRQLSGLGFELQIEKVERLIKAKPQEKTLILDAVRSMGINKRLLQVRAEIRKEQEKKDQEYDVST